MDIVHAIEVKVCISEDQPISIESLVASVKKLQIEGKVPESIIEGMNEYLVNSYCGERYSKRLRRSIHSCRDLGKEDCDIGGIHSTEIG